MEIYEALYPTRAMRRLKPDPIPLDVQARILDTAIRAPSGGNNQRWRFMLIDDASIKAHLGAIYRLCMAQLLSTVYAKRIAAATIEPDLPQSVQTNQMVRSAQHLADHWEETPLFLIGFAQSDSSGGSIFPSIWSAMLAARAEGIGTCLTTILAFQQETVLELLGVPLDADWKMACCVSMGYPTGKWDVAERRPVHEVSFRNGWERPVGFEVHEPLWKGASA